MPNTRRKSTAMKISPPKRIRSSEFTSGTPVRKFGGVMGKQNPTGHQTTPLASEKLMNYLPVALRWWIFALAMGFSFLSASTILYYHRVDNSITKADERPILVILAGTSPLTGDPTYAQELALIEAVQKKVLEIAPLNAEIPTGQEREPEQLLNAKHGLCYDRSRTIEKILRYSGLQTRHVSIYQTGLTGSAFQSLLTPGNPSHAVTEVLTKKGWLVVGSNTPWLSIDIDGNPVSMRQIQTHVENGPAINWRSPRSTRIHLPFSMVYTRGMEAFFLPIISFRTSTTRNFCKTSSQMNSPYPLKFRNAEGFAPRDPALTLH